MKINTSFPTAIEKRVFMQYHNELVKQTLQNHVVCCERMAVADGKALELEVLCCCFLASEQHVGRSRCQELCEMKTIMRLIEGELSKNENAWFFKDLNLLTCMDQSTWTPFSLPFLKHFACLFSRRTCQQWCCKFSLPSSASCSTQTFAFPVPQLLFCPAAKKK